MLFRARLVENHFEHTYVIISAHLFLILRPSGVKGHQNKLVMLVLYHLIALKMYNTDADILEQDKLIHIKTRWQYSRIYTQSLAQLFNIVADYWYEANCLTWFRTVYINQELK